MIPRLVAAASGLALMAATVALCASTAPSPTPAPARPRARPKASVPATPPDVFFLVGGDRVSGHTLSKGRRAFVVRTPYGRLTLPRGAVARITWGDGREESLRPAPSPSPAAPPAPPPTSALVLAVTGRSFWYAWDRRDETDPTLRLQLWLDEQELARYTDATLDPQDLPGATVNSFSFDPAALRVAVATGVSAAPPDTRPGRVTLRLELPAEGDGSAAAPSRRLRLAYQINDGTRAVPSWRDVAEAALDVRLTPGAGAVVEIAQDGGRMEFSGFGRKRMKNVASFRLEARAALDSPTPQP
jgi:hypothetical protein